MINLFNIQLTKVLIFFYFNATLFSGPIGPPKARILFRHSRIRNVLKSICAFFVYLRAEEKVIWKQKGMSCWMNGIDF